MLLIMRMSVELEFDLQINSIIVLRICAEKRRVLLREKSSKRWPQKINALSITKTMRIRIKRIYTENRDVGLRKKTINKRSAKN